MQENISKIAPCTPQSIIRAAGGCDMNGLLNGGDASMTMTAAFMKLVGLWTAKNRREQRARKFALIYTVAAMLFTLWIEFTDFYYSFGDFSVRIVFGMWLFFLVIVILILLVNLRDDCIACVVDLFGKEI